MGDQVMTTMDPEVKMWREKFGALSVEELLETALKLQCENRELQAHRDYLLKKHDEADAEKKQAFMRGKIEGLQFALRCNGVSGGEVNA